MHLDRIADQAFDDERVRTLLDKFELFLADYVFSLAVGFGDAE
jgi:hypothetical protein